MIPFPENLPDRLSDFYNSSRKLTVLTGAGLSADSGIPTFRDADGFWTKGSVNYTPEEMGTFKMFRQQPLEVWKWFLYRHTICSNASPNAGHFAIAELEVLFQDRFRLVTQNVDGLHLKAGSGNERTYYIHGTLEHARCGSECSNELYPFPKMAFQKTDNFSEEQIACLKCPKCGDFLRPHVLWFDEVYNEKYFKLNSALRTAKETGLLLIVGTSGATTLPRRIAETVLSRQGIVVDINPNENYFSELAEKKKNGYWMHERSSIVLPELVQMFKNIAGKGDFSESIGS